MTDIIRLLPDSVANQIAAGEVIQRPSSAAKELLENAIDSGAKNIQLIIRDAGKALVQVVDDGTGMNESDARMCFERHATSKIIKAEDLFAIKTMGFRGEAMASIAAVAQVELRTRPHHSETGTLVEIAATRLERQEPCVSQPGTSVMVKNLFFNVPARRNFLKSNAAETRHLMEEFQRTAMARPDIAFSMTHDGFEVFRLNPSNLRQRIVGIYGANYNERLVPVQEDTTILSLEGFIIKPEYARKTRGEQYFFVNNRFIRSSYLHHAVTEAFESLLPRDTFPSYFLFIKIDPAKIDINIHPTKTEIKFEDEKSVYAIMRAAVKRALGKFSITPSLDFEQDNTFNIPVSMYRTVPKPPEIKINPSFNPFRDTQDERRTSTPAKGWEQLYSVISNEEPVTHSPQLIDPAETGLRLTVIGQFRLRYIIALSDRGLVIIDQQAAHERVLYEKNLAMINQSPEMSQQQLFPQTIEMAHDDFVLMREIGDDIRKLGFDIREFGKNTFVINGTPPGIEGGSEIKLIEQILESYKNFNTSFRNYSRENLLKSVAWNLAVKPGKDLDIKEMQQIADDLLQCEQPNFTPGGKPVFVTLSQEDIEKLFQQRN